MSGGAGFLGYDLKRNSVTHYYTARFLWSLLPLEQASLSTWAPADMAFRPCLREGQCQHQTTPVLNMKEKLPNGQIYTIWINISAGRFCQDVLLK